MVNSVFLISHGEVHGSVLPLLLRGESDLSFDRSGLSSPLAPLQKNRWELLSA